MEKGSARTLSTEEIELALLKLEEEIKYRPSKTRSILTILVGMFPFLVFGAVVLAFAFLRLNRIYSLVAILVGVIICVAYYIGKKYIPESSFNYSSNILDKLAGLFGRDTELKDDTEQVGGLPGCLLLGIFPISFLVCVISWIAVPVMGLIFTRMPSILFFLAIVSLLVFSLTWMLREIKLIKYYSDVDNLEQKFRSYLVQAESSKEVNVGFDVVSGIERVETNQSLRKASKAFQEQKWEPLDDEELNAIRSLKEKRASDSAMEGKE